MQVTASNKYENVYPHCFPTRPSRLPQFAWIKPRSSVPKMRSVGEHLALGVVGGNLSGTREGGFGAAPELLLELAPGNPYKIAKALEPTDWGGGSVQSAL